MKANEQTRFDTLYAQHLRALKLRGYSASTIDVYARAVRRLTDYFDCVPDQLSVEQLEIHFSRLVDSHSWATVRVDRSGNAPANPTFPPSMAVKMDYSFSGNIF
ncbi:MAG: phage integrase N-terminal SAM-like domain-containing protein [Mariprofundus sp.]|nr:phage integrase N-terminal SAM-like domain-containing protein [Mariprofundus sp.]